MLVRVGGATLELRARKLEVGEHAFKATRVLGAIFITHGLHAGEGAPRKSLSTAAGAFFLHWFEIKALVGKSPPDHLVAGSVQGKTSGVGTYYEVVYLDI